jgi:hypothetical protein
MDFLDLLHAAQCGDQMACAQLLKLYAPLLERASRVDGIFDQELYHELCEETLRAIIQFRSPV